MTTAAIIETVVIGLFTCFVFWLLIPTLDRVRDKWRERAASASLTPEGEAAMLRQLRTEQASLKRLEQFRENPKDALLYIIGLVAAGLLLFAITVYLHPFRIETETIIGPFLAASSLLLLLVAIVEARNLTDRKMNESLARLRKSVEDLKAKLKVSD